MMIDQSYDGREIELPVGQVVEIRLPENPTTGFRWEVVEAPDQACKVVSDGFTTDPGPPGHPGEHRWAVRAVRAGICAFSLQSRRSFEAANPAGTFTVRIHVR